jgi:chromosome segregation ATPase
LSSILRILDTNGITIDVPITGDIDFTNERIAVTASMPLANGLRHMLSSARAETTLALQQRDEAMESARDKEAQIASLVKAGKTASAEVSDIREKLEVVWLKTFNSPPSFAVVAPSKLMMIEQIGRHLDRLQAPMLSPMPPKADAAVQHIIEQNQELRSSIRDSNLMHERSKGEIRNLTGQIDRHVRDRSEVNKHLGELGKQLAAAKEDARQAGLKLGHFKSSGDKLEAERNALRDTCVRLENEVARIRSADVEEINTLRNQLQKRSLRENDLSARLADAKRHIDELENGFARKEVRKSTPYAAPQPAPTHSEAYKAAQQRLNEFQTNLMHQMGIAQSTAQGKITGIGLQAAPHRDSPDNKVFSAKHVDGDVQYVGIDVAKPGADKTVITAHCGNVTVNQVVPKNIEEVAMVLAEMKAEVRSDSSVVHEELDTLQQRVTDGLEKLNKRYIDLEHAIKTVDNRIANLAKAAHDRMDSIERRGKTPAGTISDNINNECSRLAAENNDLKRRLKHAGITP